MSKAKQMADAAKKRQTQGSAYSDGLTLGDDFIDDLTPVSSDIVTSSQGDVVEAYSFGITSVGLDPKRMSHDPEDWLQLGQMLIRFDESLQWLIGDWLNGVEKIEYGETYDQFSELFNRSTKTLYDYKYVAGKVEFSVRTENLSFQHHALVAPYNKTTQQKYLKHADKNELNVKAFRDYIREQRDSDVKQVDVLKQWELRVKSLRKQFVELTPVERQEAANMLRQLADEIENS